MGETENRFHKLARRRFKPVPGYQELSVKGSHTTGNVVYNFIR